MATAALQYGATRSNVYLHFSEVTAESTVVYSFSEADDGSSAVQKDQEANEEWAPFDIVFMDNVVVHMIGAEAIRRFDRDCDGP